MNKILYLTIKVLLVFVIVEALAVFFWNDTVRTSINDSFRASRNNIKLEHANAKDNIESEYMRKRYQATGRNVYERIYNAPFQSITDLIKQIANEATPASWGEQRCRIEVEEFTNFLLMVSVSQKADVPSVEAMSKYLVPVIRHSAGYLSNVAVYDRSHKCRMFFDKRDLSEIKSNGAVSDAIKIIRNAESFDRYNSVTVNCRRVGNHLYVPVAIYGKGGLVELEMLLDTGASISMMPMKIAQDTGNESVSLLPLKTYNTANGVIRRPSVTRIISIDRFSKQKQVAVDTEGSTTLLGVDFFEGMNYLIDVENENLHLWETKK